MPDGTHRLNIQICVRFQPDTKWGQRNRTIVFVSLYDTEQMPIRTNSICARLYSLQIYLPTAQYSPHCNQNICFVYSGTRCPALPPTKVSRQIPLDCGLSVVPHRLSYMIMNAEMGEGKTKSTKLQNYVSGCLYGPTMILLVVAASGNNDAGISYSGRIPPVDVAWIRLWRSTTMTASPELPQAPATVSTTATWARSVRTCGAM